MSYHDLSRLFKRAEELEIACVKDGCWVNDNNAVRDCEEEEKGTEMRLLCLEQFRVVVLLWVRMIKDVEGSTYFCILIFELL